MKTTLASAMTFLGSVVVGCGAAIAIASAAAVTKEAPQLRTNANVAASEVIRLEPVTVTISKARYDELRAAQLREEQRVAKAAETKRPA